MFSFHPYYFISTRHEGNMDDNAWNTLDEFELKQLSERTTPILINWWEFSINLQDGFEEVSLCWIHRKKLVNKIECIQKDVVCLLLQMWLADSFIIFVEFCVQKSQYRETK